MRSEDAIAGGGAGPVGVAGGIRRDVLYALASLLVLSIAVLIYSSGSDGMPARSTACLVAMLLGAGVSFPCAGLAGRRPRAQEVFAGAFVSGCFAAADSPNPIWTAPCTPADMFRLSAFGAACFAILFHAANIAWFVSARKSLGMLGCGTILVLPFAFGCLLGLEPGAIASRISGPLAAVAAVGERTAQTGVRVILLLLFNEVLANAFSLHLRRMPLVGWRARLCLLVCSAGAVLAPVVADFGSGPSVFGGTGAVRFLSVVGATAVSQGLLWAEVFMLTGIMLDALRSTGPTWRTLTRHAWKGWVKGAMFSGVFMALVLARHAAARSDLARAGYTAHPVFWLGSVMALLFPLAAAIVETFDGSHSFFRRVWRSFRDPVLFARGAAAGCGLAFALSRHVTALPMGNRAAIGAITGALAYAGISLCRDGIYALRGRGRIRTWRLYAVEALMGGGIGAALFFYMDAAQLEVIRQRLAAYETFGAAPTPFDIYPILSKWGHVLLGPYTGGAKLLFNQSAMGVICWAIAAWLFAVNRAFLLALFQRQWAPVRNLATRSGFAGLVENTILVLRWGLWMSPIIATFLWQMPKPTWFNQDGAVRTFVAITRSASLNPAEFVLWSREVFLWIVAYGGIRILIWLDHMGLRVATLVNLSFIGLDRLDERVARFVGPAATIRFIPEGVKRFATWAPLLIPYYIPAGSDWDYVWNTSQSIMAASRGWVEMLVAWPAPRLALVALAAFGLAVGVAGVCRRIRAMVMRRKEPETRLRDRDYEVVAKAGGEVLSRLVRGNLDVTRRSYEGMDPSGRALFMVDTAATPESAGRWWPIVGNWPAALFPKSTVHGDGRAIRIANTSRGIETSVRITLASDIRAAEQWEIEVRNTGTAVRELKIVPYVEWVLNAPGADRAHTQYNRLFPEVEYVAGLHAVMARHRDTKKVGILAADVAPEGFLMARVDFIGRASSLWTPRALQTLRFHAPRDTGAAPDFDPAGSLLLGLRIQPGGCAVIRLLIGCANSRPQAFAWTRRWLGGTRTAHVQAAALAVRHGRRPPGTPPPYVEMLDGGRAMRVLTPFTPLPYDHTMANEGGHILSVTNRGLHTSASVNAQQNRLTTDWADIVTRELPSEAFYLFDTESRTWHSPTYEPLRDHAGSYVADFGVDGTATFRAEQGALCTRLTAFVPPDDPVGIYILTVTNRSDRPRRLRLAPYFQMALADEPEYAGPLRVRRAPGGGAVYFENPRNVFRTGPAFVSITIPAQHVITNRSGFFGRGRPVATPQAVEQGAATEVDPTDRAVVAAWLADFEIEAGGSRSVAVVLGQADDRRQAETLVRRYADVESAEAALAETRQRCGRFASALGVETNCPEFDGYLVWLQYQALTERMRARKGFYQSSGAFGFRDQLQDAVNLIWNDPGLARRQLRLHAAQQFEEGDVAHWFFLQPDGRTGLLNRSHAMDNPMWLVWGVCEYIRMTGDMSLLDERVSYLRAQPLVPLPSGRHGAVGFALRTPREEPIYRHCLRALDRLFRRGMGRHGLPLMGTGDWNDGLDAIGRKGRGESVWLGFFVHRILTDFLPIMESRGDGRRAARYRARQEKLRNAIESMWRGDRYLRAIHDDGSEIGRAGTGPWQIDALMGAWPALSGINPERARVAFDTALRLLEKERVILLGWPPLPEYGKPALGRSGRYPDGVRENGMYCHGVQWLVGAARVLSEQAAADGDAASAARYRDAAMRLWWKISPLSHATPDEIEHYGGQPNKQAADLTTGTTAGRMIWNGYTGAAGWMLRQAIEGVLGFTMKNGSVSVPADLAAPRGHLLCRRLIVPRHPGA